MIESKVSAQNYNYAQQGQAAPPKKVLRMVKSERMGGSIPVWEPPQSAAQKVEQRLGVAATGKHSPGYDSILDNVLTLQEPPEAPPPASQDQEFGFADVLDMINPIQHIPFAGHLYREITGDEIKPISKLIGGTLFGGPIGASGALVNMIVENETGKDMADNVFAAFSGHGAYGSGTSVPALADAGNAASRNNPEERLTEVVALLEQGSGSFYSGSSGAAMAYSGHAAPSSAPAHSYFSAEPAAKAAFDAPPVKPLHARVGRYNS